MVKKTKEVKEDVVVKKLTKEEILAEIKKSF